MELDNLKCECDSVLLMFLQQSAGQTLKKVRAWGCCFFISLKAGLSTLCARCFRALATDFLLERLEGAFLGFPSCNWQPRSCTDSAHQSRLLPLPSCQN